MYYFDTEKQPHLSIHMTGFFSVTTIAYNQSRFDRQEVEAADATRLYRKLGRLPQTHFEHIIGHNMIENCPIAINNAKKALLLYSHGKTALLGNTAAPHDPTFYHIPAPALILKNPENITLCMKFFVMALIFYTISRKLQFRTVALVVDTKNLHYLAKESLLSICILRDFFNVM